jgi:drug/metabolite transporter (DMT)-like permease
MPVAGHRDRGIAVLFSALSGFLWATYYLFVLGVTPRVAPSALIFYPFLFGGLGYVAWVLPRREARPLLRLSFTGGAWVRVGLFVLMQVAVLAAALTAGPVDTSLLSLVGDVVLTPFLVMVLLREGTDRARSPGFLTGVGLSAAGAVLTIGAGNTIAPLQGWGLLVGPAVPLSVAFYFLLAARAALTVPTAAVVGQATLGSALVALAISPLLPGGWAGLVVSSPVDLGLLAALGLTSFFLAPLIYFDAIHRAGLVLPALLMAGIPGFTLLLSWFVLGIVPTLLAIAGIPLAVVGALLAIRGGHVPWTPSYARRPTTSENSK